MSIRPVQIFGNDIARGNSYYPNMAHADEDWSLVEWMEVLNLSQADLSRQTDWPKAKMSDLVTGKQRYNRDILNTLARAMNIRPYELLMHPDDANGIRRLRAQALKIVESTPQLRDGTVG